MGTEDASERNGNVSLTGEQNGPGREEKQSVQGSIAIKGTRNGLLLTLEPETPFGDVLNALAKRLAEAPSFFQGASLAVDTSRRDLRGSERRQLESLLARYHVSIMPPEQPVAPIRQREMPLMADFSIGAVEQRPVSGSLPPVTEMPLEPRETGDTLFLRRTVRSGQAIHHRGNIVIIGDVNPGAEVVAGGDVMVWGVLRGLVHAGHPDNEEASICALGLSPVQLRIAHLYSRPPEGTEAQAHPEMALIRDGHIIVETWINGRAPRK